MYKKNTASQFFCFQGVDSSTGGIKSGVSWTVRRCIDGTFAAAGGTASEDGTTGWYKFAMSQADTNGNNISFNFTGTGAVPQTVNILTDGAPPDVNAAKVGGQTASASGTVTFPNATLASTTNITAASGVSLAADQAVNVTKVGGTTQTARDLGAQLDVAVSTRLAPTTAGRTLDVTTTGEAGIDWANIGAPTTSQTLSGTTIGTASAVTTVNGLAANVITATAINTGAITNTKFAAGAIDAAAIAADAIGASELAADAVTEIATGVWANATRTVSAATNITSTGAAVPITAGGLVNADAAAISTDTAAADALETMLDGTGGNKLSLSQLNIVAAGNDSAIVATGAGSGNGIYAKSGTGATGDGLRLEGKSTTGFGIYASGNGGGAGATFVGGATGNGLEAYGGATGGHGISAAGQGEGDGMILTGIGGGNGLRIVGGDTDAHAVYIQTGYGATGDGIFIECQTTLGNGINMIASGNGSGFIAYGAGTGYGAHFQGGGTSGSGIYAVGAGTGSGLDVTGGSTGRGIFAKSGTGATGDAVYFKAQSTSGAGLYLEGKGSLSGLYALGGATGSGIEASGGATSGSGAYFYAGNEGHGLELLGQGTGIGLLGNIGAISVDTYDQPGQEAPAASQTLSKMVAYLYKAFRNKIEQTSTTMSLYNDAGSTVDQKATVSDNGTTFTRGEIGSGP